MNINQLSIQIYEVNSSGEFGIYIIMGDSSVFKIYHILTTMCMVELHFASNNKPIAIILENVREGHIIYSNSWCRFKMKDLEAVGIWQVV